MNPQLIPCDPKQPLDTLTTSEIIGRNASPVTMLRQPNFPTVPPEPVRFGKLGEWLDRNKIKK